MKGARSLSGIEKRRLRRERTVEMANEVKLRDILGRGQAERKILRPSGGTQQTRRGKASRKDAPDQYRLQAESGGRSSAHGRGVRPSLVSLEELRFPPRTEWLDV